MPIQMTWLTSSANAVGFYSTTTRQLKTLSNLSVHFVMTKLASLYMSTDTAGQSIKKTPEEQYLSGGLTCAAYFGTIGLSL